MNDNHRIVSVRAYVVPDSSVTPYEIVEGASPELVDWRRQKVANPLTKYPEFRDNRSAAIGRDSNRIVVVQVESASGHIGIGITNGGVASAAIIELHLADMVEGESPFAHQKIWDRMFLSTLLYGRKGIALHAISGVDLAVWDLHGRIAEQPVYSLLGGASQDSVEVYATGPDVLAIKNHGFWGAKLPLAWGPSEGEEGFTNNVERARRARELVGDNLPLFYDCWMALDVDYATRLSHAIEPLGFRWLEEPLKPDDYAGHAELRRRMPSTMTLNTGEHEYTASGFRLLCEAGVDVLQPDPTWCGGMTELVRIGAVATTFGKKIIPHVGGAYSYHYLVSSPEVSLGEFAMMSGDCTTIEPLWGGVLKGEPVPVDGRITLSDRPGFGLDLLQDVRLARPVTREMLESL